jgi:hypothetical protein
MTDWVTDKLNSYPSLRSKLKPNHDITKIQIFIVFHLTTQLSNSCLRVANLMLWSGEWQGQVGSAYSLFSASKDHIIATALKRHLSLNVEFGTHRTFAHVDKLSCPRANCKREHTSSFGACAKS